MRIAAAGWELEAGEYASKYGAFSDQPAMGKGCFIKTLRSSPGVEAFYICYNVSSVPGYRTTSMSRRTTVTIDPFQRAVPP